MKTLTKDEFIARCSAVHGDFYNYSLVEYVNNRTKVRIICPLHGEFRQKPQHHMKGSGCKECGIHSRAAKRRKSTAQFITEAIAVHGERYDYSKSMYGKHKDEKLTVTCPEHGEFSVSPGNHLKGKGCPQCARELLRRLARQRRTTTERFTKQARAIHGEIYDYGLVEYGENQNAYVIVRCREHGPFRVSPGNHLTGKGCPKCGRNRMAAALRLDTQSFLERARLIHGDTYDYSETEYGTNNEDKVKVICREHGCFLIAPNKHLMGRGCGKCGRRRTIEARRDDRDAFVRKARSVHGNDYDYSLVEYLGSATKVEIACPNHGLFSMTPNNHLRGQRCPQCKVTRGERAIHDTLTNLGVEFAVNKRFKDCRDVHPLPFDVYVPEYGLLIEYDGIHHFVPVEVFGGAQNFEIVRRRDAIRNEYAERKGYRLIRIPYWEFANIDAIVTDAIHDSAVL